MRTAVGLDDTETASSKASDFEVIDEPQLAWSVS
jgi:hypothetical protein